MHSSYEKTKVIRLKQKYFKINFYIIHSVCMLIIQQLN